MAIVNASSLTADQTRMRDDENWQVRVGMWAYPSLMLRSNEKRSWRDFTISLSRILSTVKTVPKYCWAYYKIQTASCLEFASTLKTCKTSKDFHQLLNQLKLDKWRSNAGKRCTSHQLSNSHFRLTGHKAKLLWANCTTLELHGVGYGTINTMPRAIKKIIMFHISRSVFLVWASWCRW